MKTTRILLFSALLMSCKREKPVTPTPPPAPVCCPSEAPVLHSPALFATISAPITFRWSRVQGAAYYAIVADCGWTSPAGVSYIRSVISATTTDTTYILHDMPDNIPSGTGGRWRVAAVGDGPTAGPYAGWRTFTVQQ